MTLTTPDSLQIESLRQAMPLHKWLGTHHRLPYHASNEAVMLVTHSNSPRIVGQIVPVSIHREDSAVTATVDPDRHDNHYSYDVEGVVYDPLGSTMTGGWGPDTSRLVASPYEGGWVWGRVSQDSTAQDPKIAVQGGVGVAAPIMDGGPALNWTVRVPSFFRIEDGSALPDFTDNYTMLRAKMQRRNNYSKERMVQTVLIRQMLERGYDEQVDADDFPKFRHSNAYYIEYDLSVVIPTVGEQGDAEGTIKKVRSALVGGDLERFNETLAKSHNARSREALFFRSSGNFVGAFHVSHPEEARDRARNFALTHVKDTYGSYAGLMHIHDVNLHFAGVN